MSSSIQKNLILASAMAMLLAGCRTVGPNYRRPVVEVPAVHRGADAQEAPGTISLGDQRWQNVFVDEQLRQLIQVALEQNYDVRIAAARILQAEALLGITRADQLPTVEAGASSGAQRTPASGPFPKFETSANQATASLFWELDFWGKYRRATEAARATLLANEWARQAVVSTLVADVAESYFRLRALDLELEISRRTLATRQESLQLIQDLADAGIGNLLDVRQAEQLVYTAGARIPELERQIEQEENFISILVGENPGPVVRGRMLTEQPLPVAVPVGLPSSLLERRPDILQAEQQLIASNAEIGVAKAAYFPQISLTGAAGFQSSALTSLFSGPAGLWNIAGGLTQPLFAGGRIRAGVEFTEARQQEALLVYQQTIQQAFREVSDALVAYRKNREQREQQEMLSQAAQNASELAEMRYRAGVTSYLEVLTNQTNFFSAELGLAQSRLAEIEALVQLYRALGGGWQS